MKESRRMRRFGILSVLLLTVVSASALNASGVLPDWEIPSTATLKKKLGPPPAPNSAEAKEDLATVIRMQKLASARQIAVAKRDYNLSVFTFSEVLGREFTAARYPLTAKFFSQLNDLVQHANTPLKNFYKRPHPYQVDPKGVKQIVVAVPGYSYPSYHSARCVVFSRVLAALDPVNKELFAQVAEQVEWDRVLAGEHFPSDIRAGIKLGEMIYASLVKDPGFQAELRQVQMREWTPPPKRPRTTTISIPKK
jgi:acid phosphatase (class A)